MLRYRYPFPDFRLTSAHHRKFRFVLSLRATANFSKLSTFRSSTHVTPTPQSGHPPATLSITHDKSTNSKYYRGKMQKSSLIRTFFSVRSEFLRFLRQYERPMPFESRVKGGLAVAARKFLRNFDLSRPYCKFRKEIRETLGQGNT